MSEAEAISFVDGLIQSGDLDISDGASWLVEVAGWWLWTEDYPSRSAFRIRCERSDPRVRFHKMT